MADWTPSEKLLLRRSLTRGETSAELMTQVKSCADLLALGVLGDNALDRVKVELEAIVNNELGTRMAVQASFKASKTLRIHFETELEWPSPTPDLPVTRGYWPYNGDPALADLASWEDLDMNDTFGDRDRHRTKLMGPPPWSPGQPPPSADDDPDDDWPEAA